MNTPVESTGFAEPPAATPGQAVAVALPPMNVPAPTAPAAVPGSEANPIARASLILGIFTFILGFVTGIPAIICGHIAQSRIRKSGGRLRGSGPAIAGLVLGYLSVAALPFFVIIAAIAIPNIARINEAALDANHQRIAQNITAVYMASRAAGAQYDDLNGNLKLDLDEIITQVEKGVTIQGGPFDGTVFQVPGVQGPDIVGAIKHLSLEPSGDLIFVSESSY